MEIEVGKRYVTRNGEHQVLIESSAHLFGVEEFYGKCPLGKSEYSSWNKKGFWLPGGNTPNDLIEEV